MFLQETCTRYNSLTHSFTTTTTTTTTTTGNCRHAGLTRLLIKKIDYVLSLSIHNNIKLLLYPLSLVNLLWRNATVSKCSHVHGPKSSEHESASLTRG